MVFSAAFTGVIPAIAGCHDGPAATMQPAEGPGPGHANVGPADPPPGVIVLAVVAFDAAPPPSTPPPDVIRLAVQAFGHHHDKP